MGMMDVGAFGSTFHETPNVDRLAKTGMKFNYGYAACPVCSYARASIMTGRHPVRVDITDWIPGQSNKKTNKLLHPSDRNNLAHEEVTIAEELKLHGYQTFFAGKWHLGNEGHWPTDQGFRLQRRRSPQGLHSRWLLRPVDQPGSEVEKERRVPDRAWTEESIRFLEKRNKNKPFLLYLSLLQHPYAHPSLQETDRSLRHKSEKDFRGKHAHPTGARWENPHASGQPGPRLHGRRGG